MAKMKWQSRDKILEEKKEKKKEELSLACHQNIIESFNSKVKGNIYGFSYDIEAQTNMQETYVMFQNNIIDEIVWSARKDGEKIRITLDKNDFEKVYYDGVKHKQLLIQKLKDVLEPLVNSIESEEELELIEWDMENIGQINFNTGKTMDRNIKNLQAGKEMSDMALMEVANMIMMGMM